VAQQAGNSAWNLAEAGIRQTILLRPRHLGPAVRE
jgi:hypothetical protein